MLNFRSKHLCTSENAHYGEAKSDMLDEDELQSLSSQSMMQRYWKTEKSAGAGGFFWRTAGNWTVYNDRHILLKTQRLWLTWVQGNDAGMFLLWVNEHNHTESSLIVTSWRSDLRRCSTDGSWLRLEGRRCPAAGLQRTLCSRFWLKTWHENWAEAPLPPRWRERQK